MSHSPVHYSIKVADPAALATFSASFGTGDTANVASLGYDFTFNSASTAVVDDVYVINGPGGVGRWLRGVTPASVVNPSIDPSLGIMGAVPVASAGGADDMPAFTAACRKTTQTAIALCTGLFTMATPGAAVDGSLSNCPSNTVIRGGAATKLKATFGPANFWSDVFVANRTVYPSIASPNAGTLADNASPFTMAAVASSGTAPPVLTLTGAPVNVGQIRVEVVAVGTGALGSSTVRWSKNGGVTWIATVTSAATIALTGTGLTAHLSAGPYSANNVWTALGPNGLSITIPTKPIVGHSLEVGHTAGGASGTSEAFYDIVSVANNVSPYVVTVAQPVVWPFVAADSVTELSGVPRRCTIEGGGMQVTGTGTCALLFVMADRPVIRGVHRESGDGESNYAFVLDIGTRNGLIEDCSVNLRSVGSWGVLLQSNEGGVVQRTPITNTGDAAVMVADCYGSVIRDVDDSQCGKGIVFDQVDATTFGCFYCRSENGVSTAPLGPAITIGKAAGTVIENRRVTGATQALIVKAAASDTSIQNLSFAHCVEPSGAAGVVDLSSSTHLSGLKGDNASGESAFMVYCRGGRQVIDNGSRLTNTQGGASCVAVTGGRLLLRDSELVVNGNASTIGVYATGAGVVVELDAVKMSGAGIGLYVRGGATIRMGKGVDLAGCSVAIDNSGGYLSRDFFTSSGAGWVDVPWPDIQATDSITLSVRTHAGASAIFPRIAIVPGVKFQVECAAADSYFYEIL